MSNTILEARHINKYFHDPVTVKVLDDINFSISKEEFVSVIGKSGCGKSTLLYILSTMDTDYEGGLLIDGINMKSKKEKELKEDLSVTEKKIYDSLCYEPVHIDSINELTGLSISDCLVSLLSLEFKGLIRQSPGKNFIKI